MRFKKGKNFKKVVIIDLIVLNKRWFIRGERRGGYILRFRRLCVSVFLGVMKSY